MADEDRELWDSATTDEAPVADTPAVEPEAAVEQPEPETTGQPRDEHGRFAPKAQTEAVTQQVTAEPVAPTEQTEQRTDSIPAWRLREEAEARRRYEDEARQYRQQVETYQRQLAELQRAQQPPPEVPNIFENPEGYQSHITQTFEQRFKEQELNFSLRLAHREYKQEFEAAYQNLIQRGQMGDRATVQAITSSSDPGEALMRWHRQQRLYETTGGDLEGYLSKRQEELLNDPAFLAKAAEKIRAGAGQQSRPTATVTQLPPSLNRVTSSAPSSDDGDDLSDAGLLKAALRR